VKLDVFDKKKRCVLPAVIVRDMCDGQFRRYSAIHQIKSEIVKGSGQVIGYLERSKGITVKPHDEFDRFIQNVRNAALEVRLFEDRLTDEEFKVVNGDG